MAILKFCSFYYLYFYINIYTKNFKNIINRFWIIEKFGVIEQDQDYQNCVWNGMDCGYL